MYIYVYAFCRHFYLKQLREQYMSFKLYKPMAVLSYYPAVLFELKKHVYNAFTVCFMCNAALCFYIYIVT